MFSYQEIEQLNELELEVYNYVIKQKEKILKMKIREVAQEVHVSTTTILRFCKKINCSGYSEFLFKYKQHLELSADVLKTDDNLLIDFLHKAKSQEYEQTIYDIASIIQYATKVIFLGIGSSGILAKYGARYLSSVGTVAQYIDDPFYPVPVGYYEGAVIIVLSVSGETKQIINQLRRFADFNCAVIAITNSESSTVARMADLVLAYYFPMDMLEYQVNITTQIPVVYFLERIGKQVQENLRNVEKV
ncbi:MAG: MurR/RpiR family transcriptional regulator [Culicoidibacterales bacterium]